MPLTLALPKGRILTEFTVFLERAGIVPEAEFFSSKTRRLRFSTSWPGLSLILVRSFDVATFVAFGGAQLGVAGQDVLLETGAEDLYAPVDLNIGHCRLSLAGMPEAKGLLTSASHVRVATKYPNLTRRHFAVRGIQAECIKLSGAMELAPSLGLAPFIVDLVSSGATLAANGLEEFERIVPISSRLIVNRAAWKTSQSTLHPLVTAFADAVKTRV
jgi:ATP phosphoribosyltransferase